MVNDSWFIDYSNLYIKKILLGLGIGIGINQ